jgi:hypothetical protein
MEGTRFLKVGWLIYILGILKSAISKLLLIETVSQVRYVHTSSTNTPGENFPIVLFEILLNKILFQGIPGEPGIRLYSHLLHDPGAVRTYRSSTQ